ncbi:hypothetical protein [Clostridium saccharoperbutylacetonicum]
MQDELKETDTAYQTIHSGEPQTKEVGEERYGIPVYIANYPIYDDARKSMVGTLTEKDYPTLYIAEIEKILIKE